MEPREGMAELPLGCEPWQGHCRDGIPSTAKAAAFLRVKPGCWEGRQSFSTGKAPAGGLLSFAECPGGEV